jgi:hypothetical protein
MPGSSFQHDGVADKNDLVVGDNVRSMSVVGMRSRLWHLATQRP